MKCMGIKLDIACGQRLQSGWTGLDIAEKSKVSIPEGAAYIEHDVLLFPWPIANDSVSEARCIHFVEHIPHQVYGQFKNGLILFMEEAYRVLTEHGMMTIECPYYSSQRAHQDPTHCRSITENTFQYFDPRWMILMGMSHYGIQTDFEVVSTVLVLETGYELKSEEEKQQAMRHEINAVSDIHIVLRKREK